MTTVPVLPLSAISATAILTGLLGVLIVFVVLVVLSLASRPWRHDAPSPEPQAAPAPARQSAVTAPAPDVKLIGVEEKEAAMIMAIVCDELQTPPEELYFHSIRRIDAAQ